MAEERQAPSCSRTCEQERNRLTRLRCDKLGESDCESLKSGRTAKVILRGAHPLALRVRCFSTINARRTARYASIGIRLNSQVCGDGKVTRKLGEPERIDREAQD